MATINAISVALFNAAAGGYASEMAANGAAFANAVGPVLEKDISTDALFVDHLLGNLGVTSSSSVYAQAKAAVSALVTTKGRLGATTDAIDFLKAQEGTTNVYATIAANFATKVNSAALYTAANPNERDITRLISGVTGVDTDVLAINSAVAAQKAADDANATKAAADAAAALKAANDKAAADLTAAKASADKAAADAAAALKAAQDKAATDLTAANKIAADAAVKAAADAKTAADKAAADAAAALKAAQEKGAADAVAAVTKALKDAAAASGVVGYETMTDSQLVAAIKTSDNAAVAKAVDITTDNAAAITSALKTAAMDLGVLNTSTMTNAQLLNAIAASNDAIVAQNAAQAQKALDDKALAAVDNTSFSSEQSAYDAAKALGDATAKALQAKIDALQAQVDASKAITYAVSATATSVNEGATATFIIQTTGLADGASLSYTVTDSISTAGRVATTSGTAKVDSSGVALVTVPVAANNQTDGAGTLTLALVNGKSSKAIDIADTSKTQTTWNISATDIATANLQNSPIAVTVGNSGAQTVNLATDAVTATRGFTITGNGDITVNSTLSNDTITVSGNGNNTINSGAGNDTIVVSGTGSNTINVGAGTDVVTGGAGNDTIVMGSGALDSTDRIAGGDGTDTLVISGTGNELTSANVTGVENLVLNGTTLTISSLTALQALKSIQGSSTTSEITVTVANNDVVDLTGLSLTTIKSLTLAANSGSAVAVTVKADAADLAALGSVLKTNAGAGAVTVGLSVDVEGYKALNATTDTAFTGGTVTVTDTVDNLIANKALIASATKVVSGTITGADALKLSQAGVSASLTSTMTVAEALKTLQYPDQVAALAGSKLKITGNATYAEYTAIAANSTLTAAVVAAYSASTGGYKGIAIADTTANLAAAASTINTAIGANKIGAVAISGGAALSVADATALNGITGVTGTFAIADSAAHINNSITSASDIGALLTKATSVKLVSATDTAATTASSSASTTAAVSTTGLYVGMTVSGTGVTAGTTITAIGSGSITLSENATLSSGATLTFGSNRTVNTITEALELKALGSKLTGGFDVAISTTDALTTNGLSAIAGAAKATLTGTVSVSQVNQLLAANSAAKVTVVKDNAQNLVAGASKLSAVTTDLIIEGTVTVAQASEIQPVLTKLLATGSHTAYGVSGTDYTNGYKISDVSSAILAASNAAATKGAKVVEVTNAMTLSDATDLRKLADASGSDNLVASGLTYSIEDNAKALAEALNATDNTTTVAVLAGATTGGVTAKGTATVAQANILGASYSGVQVDSWALKDTVKNLFTTPTGSTTVTLITAKANATSLSVEGALTNGQMAALKLVSNTASTLIFDNVYAISDSASNIATAAASSTTNLVAATAISLTDAAAAANLAGLTTLNTALTTAGKAKVTYALTDTYENIVGSTSLALGATVSGSAAVIASAKAASLITVTGNFTSANASEITAANLLTLADKAGTANYTVVVTDTATRIGSTQAGVLNNNKISKIVVDSALSVSDAAGLLTTVGSTIASKVEYNLQDAASTLVNTANSTTVLGAKNITAHTGSAVEEVSVATAQKLLNLTGASGTVTYSINDEYSKVAANAAAADGASIINVSDTSLTAAQYANLLNLAKATATVTTTVSAEAIVDTAAGVNAASAVVLEHASGVTLSDVGALTLNIDQARALWSSAWKLATSTSQPGGAAATVKIVDTTKNLLALKADSVSGSSTATESLALLNSSNAYQLVASDVAELSDADAATLTGISHLKISFIIKDTADSLTTTSGSVTADAHVAKATSLTIVTNGSTNVTNAAEAKAIYDANKNVTFDKIVDVASAIGASTVSGYTYAAAAAKATTVEISSAASVSAIKAAKAAVGTTPVTYSLIDTAENLASADGKALLAGATGLTVSGGVSAIAATALQAVELAAYAAKFGSTGFPVTDTAANLVANLTSAKAALGTVTLTSGETASVAQFSTLKGELGSKLATTNISDSASKVADFLIAGSTTGAGTYTLTSDVSVNAAQAKALATASVAVSSLIVTDPAENLLTLGDAFGTVTTATASGTVDLATAKQLAVAFETTARFDVATTADRFVAAYSDTTATDLTTNNTANLVDVLKMATTITVDGTAVTLGIQNASLIAGSRSSYNSKIVGTVEQINALPAALKNAAGYVVVDTLANITSPANTALIASGSGYVVKDFAANITAAGSSVLQTVSGALGIQVDDAISVATLGTILANTNTDSYVKYSLADSAAYLVSGSSAVSGVSGATNVTVTGAPATAAQAKAIFTAKSTAVIDSVVDTVAGITALSALGTGTASINAAKSITIDGNLSTAGLQGIGASDASTIVTNKGTASLTFNIADTASNVVNSSYLTAVKAAGSVTVDTTTTAATAAQAKTLATFANVVSGYTVADSASALTTTTTVALSDLAKAGVVKVNSGTATAAEASILVGLANIEKGTDANASKVNFSISDSAKNLASANASVLDAVTSTNTVVVGSYTDALTAAEATNLVLVDAASSKLTVDWANSTNPGIAVKDQASLLLANGAAVTKAESVEITDAVSVAVLNQIKAIDALDSTVNTSGGYTYNLKDSATALIVAGVAAVDKATVVNVTGSSSVQDLTTIELRINASGSNVTTSSTYEKIVGTEAQLFGSSGGTTLNTTVGAKATVISLTGAATVDQVKALKLDSSFDGVYAVSDSAANLLTAINNADNALLVAASSVRLATGQTATVSQANAIASQLTNEGAFALVDYATELNAAGAANVVANAASVVVLGSATNDNLSNGTAAKVTFAVGDLANLAATPSTTGVDVLYLKAGDVISFSGISDFDAGVTAPTFLTLNADSSLGIAEYQITRGFYGSDGSFVASSNGTDTLIELGTDGATIADQVIVLIGTTSLTTIGTSITAPLQVIGFTAG